MDSNGIENANYHSIYGVGLGVYLKGQRYFVSGFVEGIAGASIWLIFRVLSIDTYKVPLTSEYAG